MKTNPRAASPKRRSLQSVNREESFPRECKKRRLRAVAVCDGSGPGIAMDKRGNTYALVAGEFDRVPLAHSVGWYERIFESESHTTFEPAFQRWLLRIATELHTQAA